MDGLNGLVKCLHFDEQGIECEADAEVWFTSDVSGVYPSCEQHWKATSGNWQKAWVRLFHDRNEFTVALVMAS